MVDKYVVFEKEGLKGKVKTMAGGAAVCRELADEMKADGYGKDAISCVESAKELVGVTG